MTVRAGDVTKRPHAERRDGESQSSQRARNELLPHVVILPFFWIVDFGFWIAD
jgi:hypothetical protein